jgi:acid phosphatase class B
MNMEKLNQSLSIIAIALGAVALTAVASSYVLNEKEPKTTFAVFDPQTAIASVSIPALKQTKNADEAKQVVTEARIKVEDWVKHSLNQHCPAPCVVFNKGDVVLGDLVDLNKRFEADQKPKGADK